MGQCSAVAAGNATPTTLKGPMAAERAAAPGRALPSDLYETERGQQLRYECQQVLYQMLRAARDAIAERTRSEGERARLFSDYLRQIPEWSDAQLRGVEEYALRQFAGMDDTYREGLKIMAVLSGVLRGHRVFIDRRPRLRAFLHQIFIVAANAPSVETQAIFQRSEVLQIVAQDACRRALHVCLADTEKARKEGKEPTRVLESDSEVFGHLRPSQVRKEVRAEPSIRIPVPSGSIVLASEYREPSATLSRDDAETNARGDAGAEGAEGAEGTDGGAEDADRGDGGANGGAEGDGVGERVPSAMLPAGAGAGEPRSLVVRRGDGSGYSIAADGTVSALLFSGEDGELPASHYAADDAASLLTFGGISAADPMDSITMVAVRRAEAAATAARPEPIAEEPEMPSVSASEKADAIPVASDVVFAACESTIRI